MKFKLLQDKPIASNKTSAVQFGYAEVSEAVCEVIKSSPKPFTLGLFGRWGTGKSTVITQVTRSLDQKEFLVVTFDAWKYEEDALRRSFLIDTAEQLVGKKHSKDIDKKFVDELKEHLYITRSEDKKKFGFDYKTLVVAIGMSLLLLAINFLVLYATRHKQKTTIPGITAALSIGLLPFAAAFLKSLDKSIFVQNISLGIDKVNSPEEFYSKFKKILTACDLPLLVIIDNLDRTQKDKTVELLGTIKTFLNSDDSNDQVVFLIASDEKAIREHIKAVYAKENKDNSSEFSASEFLKKFFNAVIYLPTFVNTEISDYTGGLLKQTGLKILKDNKDIEGIINAAYSNNPREIKQAVNNITSYYVMLVKIGAGSGLSKDFLDENIAFITKLIIIRDRFPEIYEQISKLVVDDLLTWNEVTGSPLSAQVTGKDGELYKLFEQATEWVQPSEDFVSWLFFMRRTKEDLQNAGWDQFVRTIPQQDTDRAAKIFGAFKDTGSLDRQLCAYANSIKNDSNRWTAFSLVTLYSIEQNTATHKLSDLKNILNLIFRYFPESNDLFKIIGQIDLNFVFNEVLPIISSQSINKLNQSLVSLFSISGSDGKSVLKQNQFEQILSYAMQDKSRLSKFQSGLRGVIESTFNDTTTLRSVCDSVEKPRDFISPTAYTNFIANMTQKDLDDETIIQKLSLLNDLTISDKDNVVPAFLKYYEVATWISSATQYNPQRENYSAYITQFLEKHAEMVNTDSDVSHVNAVLQYIHDWYNQATSIKEKSQHAFAMIPALHLTNSPNITLVHAVIKDFIANTGDEYITEALDKFSNAAFDNFINTDIISRVVERPDAYDAVKGILNPDSQVGLLNALFAKLPAISSPENAQSIIDLAEIVLREHTDKQSLINELATALTNEVDRNTDYVDGFSKKRNGVLSRQQKAELAKLVESKRQKDQESRDQEAAADEA